MFDKDWALEIVNRFLDRRSFYSVNRRTFLIHANGDMEGLIKFLYDNGVFAVESDYSGVDCYCVIRFAKYEGLLRLYKSEYFSRPYMLAPGFMNLRSSNNAQAGITEIRRQERDCVCMSGYKRWEHDLYNANYDRSVFPDCRIMWFAEYEARITEEFIDDLVATKWGGAGVDIEARKRMRALRMSILEKRQGCISSLSAAKAFRIEKDQKPAPVEQEPEVAHQVFQITPQQVGLVAQVLRNNPEVAAGIQGEARVDIAGGPRGGWYYAGNANDGGVRDRRAAPLIMPNLVVEEEGIEP